MHSIYHERLTSKQKRKRWQKIIDEYRESGLSQSHFAKAQGLKPEQLSYYYRQLKDNGLSTTLTTAATFIPIALKDTVPVPVASSFILQINNNLQLTIPNQFDANSLSRLLQVLEGKHVNLTL